MNKIIRLLLIGMVSILSAQTATLKNSITGYSTLGDTVSFDKPYVWTFIKSDDSKWMASVFVDAPWARGEVYVEELFYKPYSDKFTIGLGRQAIPFGSNVPYLDLTRGDKFTYQTPTPNDVGLLYYTWTCWYPTDKGEPCGKCKICKERIIECRSIGDIT